MVHSRFMRPKSMAFVLWLLALSVIIACGGAPATSTPETKGEAPTPNLVTEVLAAGVAAATPVPEATRAPAPAL